MTACSATMMQNTNGGHHRHKPRTKNHDDDIEEYILVHFARTECSPTVSNDEQSPSVNGTPISVVVVV